jgi:hypothetical protein
LRSGSVDVGYSQVGGFAETQSRSVTGQERAKVFGVVQA